MSATLDPITSRKAGPAKVPHRLIGTCCGLAAAVAFASMNLCARYGAGRLSAAACLGSRGLVGALVLAPVAWRQARQIFSLDGWSLWTQCIFGAVASLALFHNVDVLSVGAAVSLSYLAPILVALVAPLLFGERLGGAQVCGIAIMGAGAASLQMAYADGPPSWATVVGLGGAFSGGISLLALKRASQKHSPGLVAWAFCLFATAISATMVTPTAVAQAADAWTLALVVGLLGTSGQVLLSLSFKHLPAGLAGALSLTTLIFSVLFESLYTSTWPESLQMAGYALMCLGLLLLQRQATRRVARKPAHV